MIWALMLLIKPPSSEATRVQLHVPLCGPGGLFPAIRHVYRPKRANTCSQPAGEPSPEHPRAAAKSPKAHAPGRLTHITHPLASPVDAGMPGQPLYSRARHHRIHRFVAARPSWAALLLKASIRTDPPSPR
ncbi:hypothetical protein PCANC_13023 [Puccinia coronata f. sp. avenae]|uniref:Uncharacterized protein n=1 Tax=Puccinia coronata f. sp. avenae TaxID=200324 RepID=A0A2N5SSK2_9BASI|nr:hypothetical protein PCANC_12517 [Puccinia coronata f. sp. avenae]PLW40618.1 hypothetical protein PCANC_13023 [Puccinia coronata f. sp. avenae]PLW48866.1 hypothetical protein PCASD_02779 [Puccinia coronata f. sp. avenae]